MIFFRRDVGPDRFTGLRVSLLFLAAGLWLAGVITETAWVTGLAILILVGALLLRIAGRLRDDEPQS